MARVFSAVSSREPSSASSAVSPSGWIRTLWLERGGGMCAHKDRVEHAGREADAEQRGAGEADRPRGDDGRDREVPCAEVAAHGAQARPEIEQVRRPAGGGTAR